MLSCLLSKATSELKKCRESITSVTLWVLIDLIFVKFKEFDRLKTEKCQSVSALSLPVASSQQNKRLCFNTLKPPGSSNYLVGLILSGLFCQTFRVHPSGWRLARKVSWGLTEATLLPNLLCLRHFSTLQDFVFQNQTFKALFLEILAFKLL